MANTQPIFPATPVLLVANLVAAGGSGTSRAPTTSASISATPVFGVEFKKAGVSNVAPSAGRRIDRVQVKGCANTIGGANTLGSVIIWVDDGVTGYPVAEILLAATTPSLSAASIDISTTFTTLVLPSGAKLWASMTTIPAAANNALCVYAFGGDY